MTGWFVPLIYDGIVQMLWEGSSRNGKTLSLNVRIESNCVGYCFLYYFLNCVRYHDDELRMSVKLWSLEALEKKPRHCYTPLTTLCLVCLNFPPHHFSTLWRKPFPVLSSSSKLFVPLLLLHGGCHPDRKAHCLYASNITYTIDFLKFSTPFSVSTLYFVLFFSIFFFVLFT